MDNVAHRSAIAVNFYGCRRDLVAQSKIESQSRSDAPVVLQIETHRIIIVSAVGAGAGREHRELSGRGRQKSSQIRKRPAASRRISAVVGHELTVEIQQRTEF